MIRGSFYLLTETAPSTDAVAQWVAEWAFERGADVRLLNADFADPNSSSRLAWLADDAVRVLVGWTDPRSLRDQLVRWRCLDDDETFVARDFSDDDGEADANAADSPSWLMSGRLSLVDLRPFGRPDSRAAIQRMEDIIRWQREVARAIASAATNVGGGLPVVQISAAQVPSARMSPAVTSTPVTPHPSPSNGASGPEDAELDEWIRQLDHDS